ncbi:MAG TPA: KEOPS complex kinase/ATPase Bud32 [Candidatus Acidoferrales bacterium]|nr:KEOPS complex kinase/ATPase Bud32 [Candidatus Acidoferrales bacterium]
MQELVGETNLPRMIYKGAEAEIYLERWLGELCVRKKRVPKPYRVAELDETIRRSRTVHEATLMHEVRKLGVPVPTIYHIDPEASTFLMEYLNGPTLKEELAGLSAKDREERCHLLGRLLAKMHVGGIVHGDMTISNVVSLHGKLFLIDFGLGGFSKEMEDRGVDLLLLNRAMKSTHIKFHAEIFSAFLKGYTAEAGRKVGKEAEDKMREIERRGRYFDRG